MGKKESASAFLRRITGVENDKAAREKITALLTQAEHQRVALTNMGTVTIIVIPGGALGWHISSNLMNRVALDSVDIALNDVHDDIIKMRRQLIDQELQQKISQQEDSNGENSINSTGNSKDGS